MFVTSKNAVDIIWNIPWIFNLIAEYDWREKNKSIIINQVSWH